MVAMTIEGVRMAPPETVVQTAQTVQAAQVFQSQQRSQEAAEAAHQEAAVLRETAAELENISSTFNKRLQFVVDHSSNDVIVKVIDRETDKVIRELPPEEMQRLHSKLKETIGLLLDEFV